MIMQAHRVNTKQNHTEILSFHKVKLHSNKQVFINFQTFNHLNVFFYLTFPESHTLRIFGYKLHILANVKKCTRIYPSRMLIS